MPQSQSQPPTTQACSTKARSYLCYEYENGKETIRRPIPIYPYQSNMVKNDGTLLSAYYQADDRNRPINEQTAWETKENDDSLACIDVASKVG